MVPVPGRPSRDLKRLSVSLALVALQRLADPEVRAQVAEQGRTLAANAKDWQAERAARRSAVAIGSGAPAKASFTTQLTGRLGRAKLDRRVERLRSSVLALGEGRPELAHALDPVLAALEEVTSAIEVAALLPLSKRLRAHIQVDRILDDLESSLFQAALPSLPPRPPGS